LGVSIRSAHERLFLQSRVASDEERAGIAEILEHLAVDQVRCMLLEVVISYAEVKINFSKQYQASAPSKASFRSPPYGAAPDVTARLQPKSSHS